MGKLRRLRVEPAIQTALAEDPQPTFKQIANRLGLQNTWVASSVVPNSFSVLAARGAKHLQKRLARIRAALQAALNGRTPSAEASCREQSRIISQLPGDGIPSVDLNSFGNKNILKNCAYFPNG